MTFSLAATRTPPANLEAEQALLGALLASNKAYERVSEFLRPEHFADDVHGAIYGAIQRRMEAGRLADVVTLRAEFEQNGTLDAVGGVAYLGELLVHHVGIINAGEYGRVIEDAWLRLQLVELGTQMVNRAYGDQPELMAREQLEEADTALLALGEAKSAEGMRDGAAVAASLIAFIIVYFFVFGVGTLFIIKLMATEPTPGEPEASDEEAVEVGSLPPEAAIGLQPAE